MIIKHITGANNIIGRFVRKPPRLHGINPKLTYEPSGVSFELPRFCSVEMLQARQMNKIALRQAKAGNVARTYSKASTEDLKRLTSDRIEDSFSRVEWTNPKDGKLYNILSQGQTEDGKVLVRILDNEGAFVKEAALTPKTIVIPDDYTETTRVFGLSHGELVTLFAKRHNPFAKYVPISIDRDTIYLKKELDGVFDYLNKGGTVDYISCSYGTPVNAVNKLKMPPRMMKLMEQNYQYDRLADRGIRVLCGGHNASGSQLSQVRELSNNILVTNLKAEGVGSLSDNTGRISDFSLSRNSQLTQHYEVGEFTPRMTKHGLNITGTTGTDIGLPTKYLENLSHNPLIGKPVEKVNHLMTQINLRLKELQKEKFKLFSNGKPLSEVVQEKAKIESKEHIYTQRRIKLLNYINGLQNVNGVYQVPFEKITGTSFATPVRTAKLALNDMMEGVI